MEHIQTIEEPTKEAKMVEKINKKMRFVLSGCRGHIFRITSITKDRWGNRINLTCAPQCCTFPNYWKLTIPEKEFHVMITKKWECSSL
jgi:hypothetical protein